MPRSTAADRRRTSLLDGYQQPPGRRPRRHGTRSGHRRRQGPGLLPQRQLRRARGSQHSLTASARPASVSRAEAGRTAAQLMKSWRRTVLRPFALARFAACSKSQYMYSLRAANASPAVLQPAFLRTPFALLAMTRDSRDFLAISDLRVEELSSDCESFTSGVPIGKLFSL